MTQQTVAVAWVGTYEKTRRYDIKKRFGFVGCFKVATSEED